MLRLPVFLNQNGGNLVLGRIGKFPFAPLVRLSAKEREGHLYIIGSSGKGKSKLLENILIQDIAASRGCGMIDPHSLLADDLLRSLASRRILANPTLRKKLIYIDPARMDYVVPFNVLSNPQERPYEIATMVLEAFRRTWPESLKEAPHFTNVIIAALLVLIENHLTLMHMPRLLTNKSFRDKCLDRVTDPQVVEFFHQRFDRWENRSALRNESILNKVGAFSLNPSLRLMLGQPENQLNFREIMDQGKILLLDLGHADPETSRLIGSLVVTGIELAMRSRQQPNLWNLVIDEFADYVSTEGSMETLAQVFTAGRKFGVSLTIAHQHLAQLTPGILGALSNVQTKVIFGVGRPEAEYFARIIGRVEPEEVKREPLTETQHKMFSPLSEQWEKWVDQLHYQKDRWATVATREGRTILMRTVELPAYTATDEEVEMIRHQSLKQYGIPYAQAERRIEKSLARASGPSLSETDVPTFEVLKPKREKDKPEE